MRETAERAFARLRIPEKNRAILSSTAGAFAAS